MPDQYGPLPLPVPVPGSTDAVADPLLNTLLSFFTAVLNAQANAAWTAIAPGTGNKVVKTGFVHNPDEQAFKLASTPALYLWRETIMKAKQIAADWRVRPSRLMLRWVPFPVYQQDRARRWEPFFNAIPSILDEAVERGRHPSWIVAGDTDPRAPTAGSLLWTYAPVHKLEIAREDVRRGEMVIPIEGERGPTGIDVVDVPIELEERLVRSVSGAYAELAYAQVQLQVPPAPNLTTNTGRFAFDPD